MDTQHQSVPRYESVLLLLAVGLFLIAALQTYALAQNGSRLGAVHTAQANQIEQAVKIRSQLDAIAGKTAKLAAQGNKNAQAIVDDLKKQGITIKPSP